MIPDIGPSYEQLVAINSMLQSDLQHANEALIAAQQQVTEIQTQLRAIQEVTNRQLSRAATDTRRINLAHKLIDAKANIGLFFSVIGVIFAAAVGRFWK